MSGHSDQIAQLHRFIANQVGVNLVLAVYTDDNGGRRVKTQYLPGTFTPPDRHCIR